jgi:hypothetical protein
MKGFQLLQLRSLRLKPKLYYFPDAAISGAQEGGFQVINVRPQSGDLCQKWHDTVLYDTVQSGAKRKSGPARNVILGEL